MIGFISTNFRGSVFDVVIESSGDIIVGQSDGFRRFSLIEFDENGYINTTFGGEGYNFGGYATGYQLLIGANGGYYVSGYKSDSSFGPLDFVVVRFDDEGNRDHEFGVNGVAVAEFNSNSIAYSAFLSSSKDIFLAGSNGDGIALAKFNSDGILDISFGIKGLIETTVPNGANIYDTFAVPLENGQILVGTSTPMKNLSWSSAFVLVRYSSNGVLDTSFGKDGFVVTNIGPTLYAEDLLLQPDGKVIIVGRTGEQLVLARYHSDGRLDTVFGGDGIVLSDFSGPSVMALQPDGKILVAGADYSFRTGNDYAIIRYNANGSVDTTFGGGKVVIDTGGFSEFFYSISVQDDGKIIAAGVGSDNGSAVVARFNSNGVLDQTFDGKLVSEVSTNIVELVVDAGVLSSSAVLLKGLEERIIKEGCAIVSHTIGYLDVTYDYQSIDALITIVLRNDEFTDEFSWEIADFAPSVTGITYHDAISLVGIQAIDGVILAVAGADGFYVS